jgi:hypothetical protein
VEAVVVDIVEAVVIDVVVGAVVVDVVEGVVVDRPLHSCLKTCFKVFEDAPSQTLAVNIKRCFIFNIVVSSKKKTNGKVNNKKVERKIWIDFLKQSEGMFSHQVKCILRKKGCVLFSALNA